MSILTLRNLQGIQAYNNTITVPENHKILVDGELSISNVLNIPVWNNFTRPQSPQIGYIGYNTSEDVNTIEIYDGSDWISLTSSGGGASVSLPSGYVLAMTMDSADGGRLAASTWTISGTGITFNSTGGVNNSGYFSNVGRTVNSSYFRINEMPIVGTTTDLTFCIWYKGTQSVAPATYGPAVPLFGDTRGSVYGGFGMSNGRCEFRDSGNAYQGPAVNTGQWTHIVFSMTTTNNLKIYVNGALANSYSSVAINETYCRPSDIGAHYPYSGYVPPEAIDQPVVYNRILTDAEVLQVYQASNFSS